jgi:hypothetical protein
MARPNFKPAGTLCKVERDRYGTTYHVPADADVKTPGGILLPGNPGITVFWERQFKKKANETLMVRQENGKHVDLIQATLPQLYALIEALNAAVEHT